MTLIVLSDKRGWVVFLDGLHRWLTFAELLDIEHGQTFSGIAVECVLAEVCGACGYCQGLNTVELS